jgi:hypothetical protein
VLDLYDDRECWLYEVDLERCGSAAAVLDWIMQVSGKAWATAEIRSGLVEALDDLLDPQTRLCAWGVNGAAEHEPADDDIAEVVRANEIETRAWRLAGPRLDAIAAERHWLAGVSLTDMHGVHERAVQEVRDDLGEGS